MDIKINFEKHVSFSESCSVSKTSKEILLNLASKLSSVTKDFCVPWIRIAKNEGVDISEENQILEFSKRDSLKNWDNQKSNREPTLRRLIELRTRCTFKILHKVYQKRIELCCGSAKEKSKQSPLIIDHLAEEALFRIKQENSWKEAAKKCGEIFSVLKGNLELLIENPKEYHRLADLEYARRGLFLRVRKLLQHEENCHRISRIIDFANRAFLELFGEERGASQRVNNALEELEKQLDRSFQSKICRAFIYGPEKK